MNAESIIELQKLDCNCNECKFMVRDLVKLESHKKTYEGTGLMDRLAYGDCSKFNKPVSFIPGTCQLHTQECFTHREYIRTWTLNKDMIYNRYGTEFEVIIDKFNAQMIRIKLREGNLSETFAIPNEMVAPIIKRLKQLNIKTN